MSFTCIRMILFLKGFFSEFDIVSISEYRKFWEQTTPFNISEGLRMGLTPLATVWGLFKIFKVIYWDFQYPDYSNLNWVVSEYDQLDQLYIGFEI